MKPRFTHCRRGHPQNARHYSPRFGRCRLCQALAARVRYAARQGIALKAPTAVAPCAAVATDSATCSRSPGAVRPAAGASHSAPGPGKGSGIAPHGKGSGADLSLDYDRPPGFPHDGDFDLPERLTPAAPCLDCGHGVGHYAQCAAAGLS